MYVTRDVLGVVLGLALVGCGDTALDLPSGISRPDFAQHVGFDFALPQFDLAQACMQVDVWPSDQVTAQSRANPFGGYDFMSEIMSTKVLTNGLFDTLRVELYVPTGQTPSYPTKVKLTASDRYNTCDACLVLDSGYDPNGTSGSFFFGQGGELVIEQADETEGPGTMHVSGSSLHIVEWSYNGSGADDPLPGGRCYDVGSFDFTATYTNNNADGGVDM